jgi:hypothetical protein
VSKFVTDYIGTKITAYYLFDRIRMKARQKLSWLIVNKPHRASPCLISGEAPTWFYHVFERDVSICLQRVSRDKGGVTQRCRTQKNRFLFHVYGGRFKKEKEEENGTC